VTSGAAPAPNVAGVWASLSELAKMRGRDKAGVSRRVASFEKQGLLKTQVGKGGRKLVPIAEYDRLTAELTDGVRALNGAPEAIAPPAAIGAPGDPVLAREQARRAGYDADLKRLDLQERLGELGRVEEFRLAMRTCAEGVVQILEQLPGRVEEIQAALAKGGLAEGRAAIRLIVRETRELIARAMTAFIERERQVEQSAAEEVDAA
jgi:hypothetical protein